MTARLVCLPGASGSREFWQPVCSALTPVAQTQVLGWPGLGEVPAQAGVSNFEDLVGLVKAELMQPAHVAAQSMGGVVALRVALERQELVKSLILCATAGGLNMAALGAVDWRKGADEWHPTGAPRWFLDDRSDLSERISNITVPTLLLWGDQDPLSPVAVGEHLAELLPDAELVVVPGGEHDFVRVHFEHVSSAIREHLQRCD